MPGYELDLHGQTWAEAIEEFIRSYNVALRNSKGSRSVQISVIHGYGSSGAGGILRTRFRGFLDRHADCLEYTPGERVDGNPGYTVIRPLKRLPDIDDQLARAVWEYCERPRSVSKIVGKFRRHGQPSVMDAIRSLQRHGRLETSGRGGVLTYVAQ